ncbi:MAG TPA: ribosome-associated translation inhibitor RaiA [candidate division Zixibacteria bacterium]|mgnify:CR=1 FL=1|nr:ribosome-associated translation inhibitor RaiA [candidate division Zixibacteria bacterium]
MDLRITARHFELTDEIKDYADKRMAVLDRYESFIHSAHLVLEVEKHRQMSEITLQVNGQSLVAHSVTDDMYASIDETSDKIERQLRKYHGKMTDYHV